MGIKVRFKSPVLALAVIITLGLVWFTNFYKLTECDFELPLKCEVIHGLGLIPALSLFTFWINVPE